MGTKPKWHKIDSGNMYIPLLQYTFVADFQMKPGLCETDPNSPDTQNGKIFFAQWGASVYS